MPRQPIDLASDTYVAISKAQANRRCINLYKHVDDGQSLSGQILVGSPGLSEVVELPYKTCRGMIETKGRLFVVYSTLVYEIDSAGAATLRGTIATNADENPVRMASNGFVIAIITDNNGYFFDLSTNSVSEIVDAAFSSFGTVIDVKYKDGYFFYLTEDYIFNGSLVTTNDGKDFSALSFGSAEIEPDGNVGEGVLNNQLYVFGQNTIEVFENIGGTNFPLQRISGGTIQKGCVARDTIINFQGALSFLGADRGESPSLYFVQGSQMAKITTPAIENYIQGLTKAQWQYAFCWTYQQGGSNFLVLDIGDATFVYDATSSSKSGRTIWHERQSGDIDWIGYKTWRAKFSASAFGKIYVGDKNTGKVGMISYDTYSEYGERIAKGIQSQPFNGEYVSIPEIEVICEMGIGNSTIENPTIELSYSDDQGVTWSNPAPRELGEEGDYKGRLTWRRLGRITRPRTLRLYTDDICKLRILKVEAAIE